MRNSIYGLIVLISIFTLISNYKAFKANVNQVRLLEILAEGTYTIEKDYLERISTNYPNLSSTVIPFKSVLGAYWINEDSIDKGYDMLLKGNKENPFIGLSDMVLATIYDMTSTKDSFSFYARSASSKLPNAPQHYVLMARLYVIENKLDSLKILFDGIKDRIYDRQIFRVYLAAVLKNRDNLDSLTLINDAKLAKSKFPQIEDVNLIADYIIYGQEKVNEVIKLRQEAIDSFPSNPKFSIKNMNNVILDIPDDIKNYEILIEMYFRNNDFNNVISIYNKLNELDMTNLTANVIEFIAISYLNLNDTVSGCILAELLDSYGVNISDSVALVCQIKE